jgi:hypothetical protein
VPSTATANIGVDSKYWLWINGTLVVFEGGIARGPGPGNTWYDEVNIQPYLKTGTNTIAVLAWYWGRNGWYHVNSGKGGLVFETNIGGTIVKTDNTWKMKVHPGYKQNAPSDNCGGRIAPYGVAFDGRTSLGDWTSSAWYLEGYDDAAWANAAQKGVPPVAPWNNLEKNPVPIWKNWGLQNYASLSTNPNSTSNTISLPYTTTANTTIYAWMDFNKMVTPYIELTASAGKVIGFESEYGATYIHQNYTTRDFAQAFEGYSWTNGHAIKYIIPAGVTVNALKYRWTSVGQQAGTFECSDPYLQKLWWMAKNTLFVCARDNYMDCPTAERSMWIGDVANENSEIWYTMDDAGRKLMKKCIQVFCTYRKNGAVLHAPTPGDYTDELPNQSLCFIGWWGLWWYHFNSGDIEALNFAYPYFKDYVNLWTMKANGLINFRGVDWDWADHPGDDATIEKEICQNVWYYMAMKAGVNMATVLGKTSDVGWYQTRMNSIKNNFDAAFWKGTYYTTGLSKDDRPNALAIVAGLASPDKYNSIVTNVLDPVRRASPFLEWVAEEACCIAGRYDVALSRMHSLYDDQVNSSTFLTTLREERNRGTYNHAWNAPNTVLSRCFAGITPDSVAWSAYKIFPSLHHLTSIHQTVPSVKGTIDVTIGKSTDSCFIALISPQGTLATFGIPKKGTIGNSVAVNGSLVWPSGSVAGITYLGQDTGYIKFTAAPGTWRFSYKNRTVGVAGASVQLPAPGLRIRNAGGKLVIEWPSQPSFAADMYDLQGKPVPVVRHDKKGTGAIQCICDTRALPPGTYIVRVSAPGRLTVQQVAITR